MGFGTIHYIELRFEIMDAGENTGIGTNFDTLFSAMHGTTWAWGGQATAGPTAKESR
jgi:hypothetical protein